MIALAKNNKPTPTVSLSLDQAAADLDTTPLGVSRLIARGALRATRLGAAGEWRILPDQLGKYIAAGAPDLQTVALDGAGWLADWPRPLGDFEQTIADAAQHALENDPTALARIAADESEPLEYVVPIVGAVLDAAKQELPGQLGPVRELRAKFATWTAFHMAERLREYARQIVSQPPRIGTTPAARFFDSPDTYRGVVQAASERLAAATISRTAYIAVETPAGQPTKKPVRLVLPVPALLKAVALTADQAADLAF